MQTSGYPFVCSLKLIFDKDGMETFRNRSGSMIPSDKPVKAGQSGVPPTEPRLETGHLCKPNSCKLIAIRGELCWKME
ncbi:hypothetical protein Cflav_PD6480 [Pedosphaera parvula Ellin514]|uniref:Uncharacterized protein n=1 Tax=Pedosphaera parvula (strain Ellin514) TaxID=320771 RepID=B9XDQ8_PEDPL|nr:hypothetical protein Cflav_PD6480 [Pedosphaera parvula Ellin514]